MTRRSISFFHGSVKKPVGAQQAVSGRLRVAVNLFRRKKSKKKKDVPATFWELLQDKL